MPPVRPHSPACSAPLDGTPPDGENIICFAKDWDEVPTSNHHVMRNLAETNRVLWINSIAMRNPSLSSGRDILKLWRKLRSFFSGPRTITTRLWVYTPIVLPFPHSALATAVNSVILQISLKILRRRLGFDDFQLWTFLPNTGSYVGKLGESVSVYYCVDEWSGFSNIDGARMAAREKELCEKVDVVFAVCRSLVEAKSKYNPETHLATHGVDHALFAKALNGETAAPADIAQLPQPVLGFYGTIQDWVDLDLIEFLAKRHPEWTIAMIGQVFVDVSRFDSIPNVHFLGRKPHSELPNYCSRFAAGIIPYIINDRMHYVNPLKLREYLCAGLPVVSTAVPEVLYYQDYCTVAKSHEEFERGIAEALEADSPHLRRGRSHAMLAETWERKVEAAAAEVARVRAKRNGGTVRPGDNIALPESRMAKQRTTR